MISFDHLPRKESTRFDLGDMTLDGKTVLITGAALRIGRSLALAVARAGGDVVLHFGKSRKDAESLQAEIEAAGHKAFILQADLADPAQASTLIERAWQHAPLYALVNNASIFDPHGWADTSLEIWNRLPGGQPDGTLPAQPGIRPIP